MPAAGNRRHHRVADPRSSSDSDGQSASTIDSLVQANTVRTVALTLGTLALVRALAGMRDGSAAAH